jgi:hypothetical protein
MVFLTDIDSGFEPVVISVSGAQLQRVEDAFGTEGQQIIGREINSSFRTRSSTPIPRALYDRSGVHLGKELSAWL